MAPGILEVEDHVRDAAFNKAMHGKSSEERAGFMAMLKKDKKAQQAAVDEYFKHWDNKEASVETEEVREVSLGEGAPPQESFRLRAVDSNEGLNTLL